MQTPLSELETNFNFEWKRAADVPFNMTDYPQAVVINGQVYIGGRVASTLSSTSHNADRTVMVYDSQLDKWSTLPPYECIFFAMAAVNNRLVLIGGYDVANSDGGITAQVVVWDGEWTKPFVPMPTARCSPSAITYIKWLIVVGGRFEGVDTKLSNVEILDTTLNQWYPCMPLPQPCSSISLTATIGNMCYALGGFTTLHEGSKKAFGVCLDELIFQAVAQPAGGSAPSTPSPWQTLPDIPLAYSTAVSLNGALFTVGGLESGDPSAAICLYKPSSKSWIRCHHLPSVRERCACITFTDHKILVVGGGSDSRFTNVDIAEIKYHYKN